MQMLETRLVAELGVSEREEENGDLQGQVGVDGLVFEILSHVGQQDFDLLN